MTVVSKIEYDRNDFYTLKANSWSGAINTLKDIENAGLEEELMEYLDELFGDEEEVDETTLNDTLWFEDTMIYEALGLDENGKLIEDEEEDV